MSKPDNITGVFLDADFERLIPIDLPLVTSTEIIRCKNEKVSETKTTYGEFAFMGDFHYGNAAFSSSVLQGYLKYLREHPNIQIGLMGDIIEYGQGSRFIKEDEKITVDDQIAQFIADFRPFAKRIKFILWGNHEERFVRLSQSKRLMRNITLELGLNPDNGECFVGEPQRGVFINFKAGNKIYGAYVQHSKTSARINQDLQLKRAGSQNVVAIICHGHTHQLAWKPRTFRALETLNGELVNVVRRQYLLATGCFLKYPSYAEAGSYPYTEVGAPIIKFYADSNQLDEYDLTSKYRNYLTKGGTLSPAPAKLSMKLKRTLPKKTGCPNCGSIVTQKRGIEVNRTDKRQRYQCLKCGKWFSERME